MLLFFSPLLKVFPSVFSQCAVSAPPTPEDLILSQYVYRPKMRIYEEDCQVLSQMIDEYVCIFSAMG